MVDLLILILFVLSGAAAGWLGVDLLPETLLIQVDDAERLRLLVERHAALTGSRRAAELLADWDKARGLFVKVMPKDYRRALTELRAAASRVAAE